MSNSVSPPWAIDHQAPLSMEFPRQENWSGLPFPSPEDLPDPGIEPISLEFPVLVGGFFTTLATWEAHYRSKYKKIFNIDISLNPEFHM